MDAQTTPILEIGLILLAAVAAGWLARRLHLPAIVGYLAVGLGFSPFTPGYVADREQLELLADVGVVLLLFEVGIEVDLTRLRRDHGAVLVAGPAQVVISTLIAGVAFLVAGLEPIAAAVIGLSRRPVVVDRHRQHHPEPPADDRSPDRGGARRLGGHAGHRRGRPGGDPAVGHGPAAAGRSARRRSGWPGSGSWPSSRRASSCRGS